MSTSRFSGNTAARPLARAAKNCFYYDTQAVVVYESDGSNWYERESLDESDNNGHLSGLDAAKPTPAGVLGYIYHATDTGFTYEAFPGAWFKVIAAEGGTPGNITEIPGFPPSFTGAAGKVLRVKSSEDEVEFVDPEVAVPGSGVSQIVDLTDFPSSFAGAAGKVLAVNDDEDAVEFVTPSGGGGSVPYAVIEEQQPNGVNAGSTSAASFHDRHLNTIVVDADNIIVSLVSDVFTLAAGTYRIVGFALGFSCLQHRCRISNLTSSTEVGYGSNAYANAAGAVQNESWVDLTFTIAVQSSFGFDHKFFGAQSDNGRGAAVNIAPTVNEVYSRLTIFKLA